MTIFLSVALALSLVCCAFLGIRTVLMKKAAKELTEQLSDELRTNSFFALGISSGDKTIKKLAIELTKELESLRLSRAHYENGDRELKTAVTNITHDLRTPLTAICGYLSLLEKENKSNSVNRYLTIIAERVERMKTLTEELFRYSVVASFPDVDEASEIVLNAALEQSLAAYYGAFSERGIEPSVRLPKTPVTRRLNETALSRIFSNVLGNVIKYGDGDLTVLMSDTGEIRFVNTASNMDAVSAGKLFDRYFTLETGRDSTGLGLAIAKTLTEKMGGKISSSYSDGKLCVALEFPKTED